MSLNHFQSDLTSLHFLFCFGFFYRLRFFLMFFFSSIIRIFFRLHVFFFLFGSNISYTIFHTISTSVSRWNPKIPTNWVTDTKCMVLIVYNLYADQWKKNYILFVLIWCRLSLIFSSIETSFDLLCANY